MSRGPGYEPTPLGPNFDARSVRGYYLDFQAKTTSGSAASLDALPAIPLIQLGLGWWERHVGGDGAALARFLELCDAVERRAVPSQDELRWPMMVPVAKYRLAAGWGSALAQGQAASLFVRAHLATGGDRFAELATRAVLPLLDEHASDLVTHARSGPILEEAPSDPPAHILNGWISALWGIWDVALGLSDDRARRTFGTSLACLSSQLPSYDTGWWSLYSLYPHAMQDLAKPIYHRAHIVQLEALHRLTGEAWLDDAARRWRGYDTAAHRTLAITQKALFAAVESRRRRRWVSSVA